jgi:hypothetical protein
MMRKVTAAVAVWVALVIFAAVTVLAEPGNGEEGDAAPHMPYETVIGVGELLLSNIPNGLITNGPVFLLFPTENVTITRNSLPFAYIPGTPIELAGQYVVSVTMEVQLRVDVFHFRVVTTPINDLAEFTAPEGFDITEALVDGIPMQILDPRVFPVWEDGEYHLTFTGRDAQYGVTVHIKRTPPQLVFMRLTESGSMEGMTVPEDGDGMFEGPVVFAPAEQGDNLLTIQVIFNRSAYSPTNNTLTEPGRYRLTVTDVAGNSTTYTFRILYIMDVPTIWIIIIASLMVVALGVYLTRNRLTMRVR